MIKLRQAIGIDRRRHQRVPLTRLAKIRPTGTIGYSPAATIDVSASGVLLEARHAERFQVGDEVELVIAWNDQPVVPRAAAVRGRVRRVSADTPTKATPHTQVRVALELPNACLSAQVNPWLDAATPAAA
jgi:c-di-GMP-binding flagellar brake protein YcgR